MAEEWRDIAGFEGKYQVSSHGRVRNIKFLGRPRSKQQERILSLKLRRDGYLSVHLSDGNKDYHPMVHRLVAVAFLPNYDNLPQVNHRDENKQNNHIDNLEWCTARYNFEYGTGQNRAQKSRKKQLAQIDAETNEIIQVWPSATDAAIALFDDKERRKFIGSCARGCYRKAYGFVWRFIDTEAQQHDK